MNSTLKWFLRILLVLVCLEVALQIYNPFTPRLKNGDIVLPAGMKYELTLPSGYAKDSVAYHSKNSLGFRGPEPSDSSHPRIICMGGSTTECFYLPDGKDWPGVLGKRLGQQFPSSWVNNAGMDGQSTFGHLKMLEQHVVKLKPDYIIFMCGLNDMSLDTPSRFDSGRGLFRKVYDFLELPSAIRNIIRAGKAKKAGLGHRVIADIGREPRLFMHDTEVVNRLKTEQNFLGAYYKRLQQMVRICRENGIKPVFVAQSILYSDENDLFTGVYLGDLKTGEINGKTRSYILKMYNRITYDVCRESDVPFINLAARLPKDSRFYYDGYHFTEEGAELAAAMIHEELISRELIK